MGYFGFNKNRLVNSVSYDFGLIFDRIFDRKNRVKNEMKPLKLHQFLIPKSEENQGLVGVKILTQNRMGYFGKIKNPKNRSSRYMI